MSAIAAGDQEALHRWLQLQHFCFQPLFCCLVIMYNQTDAVSVDTNFNFELFSIESVAVPGENSKNENILLIAMAYLASCMPDCNS